MKKGIKSLSLCERVVGFVFIQSINPEDIFSFIYDKE